MIGKLIEASKLKPGRDPAYCKALINYVASASREAHQRLIVEFGESVHGGKPVEHIALGIDLARYTGGKGNTTEKVEFAGARVPGKAADWATGVDEALRRLQKASKKRKKAVRHVVISLRPGEEPSSRQVSEMAEILCREANCPEAVVLFAKHRDTDNPHAHFVIVTVDSHGGTLPFGTREPNLNGPQAELAIHKALAWIEHAQGWSREQGRLFDVQHDTLVRRDRDTRPQKRTERSTNQHSATFERESGFWSLQTLARSEVLPRLLDPAMDWQRLHRELAELGLTVERKGNGGVVCDGSRRLKLSTIDRSISWAKLKNLPIGEFEPPKEVLPVSVCKPRVHDQHRAERFLTLRRKREAASAKISSEISNLRGQRKAITEQMIAQSMASMGHLDRIGRRLATAMLQPTLVLIDEVFQQRIASLQSLRKNLDAQLMSLDPSDIDFEGLGETTVGLFDPGVFPRCDNTDPILIEGYEAVPAGRFHSYHRDHDTPDKIPLFVDVGPLILLNQLDSEAVEVALIVAAAKWGIVRAYGDAHAVSLIAATGKRLGITVQVAPASAHLASRHPGTRRASRWAELDLQDCSLAPLPSAPARPISLPPIAAHHHDAKTHGQEPTTTQRRVWPTPPNGRQF